MGGASMSSDELSKKALASSDTSAHHLWWCMVRPDWTCHGCILKSRCSGTREVAINGVCGWSAERGCGALDPLCATMMDDNQPERRSDLCGHLRSPQDRGDC